LRFKCFGFCFNKTSCFQVELDKLMCLLLSAVSGYKYHIAMYVRWTKKNDGQILYIACHVILELTLSQIKKAVKVLSCIKLFKCY